MSEDANILRENIAALSVLSAELQTMEVTLRARRMSLERLIATMGGELADEVFPKMGPRLEINEKGLVVSIAPRVPVPPRELGLDIEDDGA